MLLLLLLRLLLPVPLLLMLPLLMPWQCHADPRHEAQETHTQRQFKHSVLERRRAVAYRPCGSQEPGTQEACTVLLQLALLLRLCLHLLLRLRLHLLLLLLLLSCRCAVGMAEAWEQNHDRRHVATTKIKKGM